MIISVGERAKEGTLNFGTHNGIFHCDEVMGMAILEIAHMKEDIHVVRSRSIEELTTLDIVIDIGGGKFDHHKEGFNICRPNGVLYASAGLVWEEFAEDAIRNVASEQGIYIEDKKIQEFKSNIDKEIITPIDQEDNGDPKAKRDHIFNWIPKLRPTFLEPQDFDLAFIRAEKITFEIMKGIIKNKVIQVATKPYVLYNKKKISWLADIFFS